LNMNYNKWKEEPNYVIRHQLIFEAERELLKREDGGLVDFLRIGEETVAGIAKDCEAHLRLSTEAEPAITVSKDGSYIGTFFLKDVDKDD